MFFHRVILYLISLETLHIYPRPTLLHRTIISLFSCTTLEHAFPAHIRTHGIFFLPTTVYARFGTNRREEDPGAHHEALLSCAFAVARATNLVPKFVRRTTTHYSDSYNHPHARTQIIALDLPWYHHAAFPQSCTATKALQKLPRARHVRIQSPSWYRDSRHFPVGRPAGTVLQEQHAAAAAGERSVVR